MEKRTTSDWASDGLALCWSAGFVLQVKCLSLCSSWERWINPFRRWIFQWPKSKVYIFFFPLQISVGLIWSKTYLKQWYQILIGPLTPLPHVLPPELSGQACDILDKHPLVTCRVTLLTALRLTSILLIQVDCPCCYSSWWGFQSCFELEKYWSVLDLIFIF